MGHGGAHRHREVLSGLARTGNGPDRPLRYLRGASRDSGYPRDVRSIAYNGIPGWNPFPARGTTAVADKRKQAPRKGSLFLFCYTTLYDTYGKLCGGAVREVRAVSTGPASV